MIIKDRPHLGSFISIAHLSGCTENSVELKFANSQRFQYNEVTKKQNLDEIQRLFREFAGFPVELKFSLDMKAEEVEQNYINQNPKRSTINDEIENEPIIQSIIEIFDGEVLQ